MTTHGNLNQITRGVIRRIDGWSTVRYLMYLPTYFGNETSFSNAFAL